MVFAEGIGLAPSAIVLEHAIMHGLFPDQIQGALQRFARRLGHVVLAPNAWGGLVEVARDLIEQTLE